MRAEREKKKRRSRKRTRAASRGWRLAGGEEDVDLGVARLGGDDEDVGVERAGEGVGEDERRKVHVQLKAARGGGGGGGGGGVARGARGVGADEDAALVVHRHNEALRRDAWHPHRKRMHRALPRPRLQRVAPLRRRCQSRLPGRLRAQSLLPQQLSLAEDDGGGRGAGRERGSGERGVGRGGDERAAALGRRRREQLLLRPQLLRPSRHRPRRRHQPRRAQP
mmetsp:Transcript_10644/g.35011  ORF Transcript_10644/g.35011 Transcript_10644/m.35011 type:complete len:223 (-) Transcript_10644:1198-1866(-)